MRGLARADEANQAVWVGRVVGLDSAATPGLADLLGQDDPHACANAEAALAALCERWNADDPRRLDLTRRLIESFSRCSAPGQQNILRLAAFWLNASPGASPSAAETQYAVARLLEEAARTGSSEAHAAALDLADKFLGDTSNPERLGACRELTQACVHDSDTENRIHAVRLALRPGMDLQKPLVALLNDSAAEVRRAVLSAVGGSKDVIETEDLLRWLHDPDAEVRRLCELALRRGRGLSPEEVHLGRLITDSSARTRLRVLNYLGSRSETGLYPEVWLRHLSHDAAPEVRFAAIRAIKDQGIGELSDRIDQMARNDPSPTVCEFAQRYLASQHKTNRQR
jgi:HEAT repeat protein